MQGAARVANEFVQHHASASGQVEHSAIDEANSDPSVGCGLDHVTLANRIANDNLNGNAALSPEGTATDRGLNVADDLRKWDRSGTTTAPKLHAGLN